MITVSDYISKRIYELTGSKYCFFLAGGGIMHLTNAYGNAKDFVSIPMLHEQAVVIAADSYGRLNNTIGFCTVTSGPGGTNAITGVAGSWLESTPLLVISGQVSRATWKWDSGVRQLGFQEIDIIPLIKNITKYSETILNPEKIRYHLEKAIYLSRNGRPGPVWLDIPLDVQASMIDEDNLEPFDVVKNGLKSMSKDNVHFYAKAILDELKIAKRPLLFGGHGVKLSDSRNEFLELVNLLNIPLQTSWNGTDLIENDHPMFFGRPNSYGPRASNIIIQNADLIVSFCSRLGLQNIGYNYSSFARSAKLIMIDLDKTECLKHTLNPYIIINCDVKRVILDMLGIIRKTKPKQNIQSWIKYCNKIKNKFPNVTPEHLAEKKYIDPYMFFDVLSDISKPGDVIIPASSGTSFTTSHQVFKIKKDQKFYTWKGLAAMGYDIPAAIGACFANNRKQVITIVGDGGIQLNIQELQIVRHYKLPIKIFVFNNNGYQSIRVTQNTFFDGHLVGCSPETGVSLPDFEQVAKLYDLKFIRITKKDELKKKIALVLDEKGPTLCEVLVHPDKKLLPKLSSFQKADGSMESRPLEELEPLLDKEIFASLMINPLYNPSDNEEY